MIKTRAQLDLAVCLVFNPQDPRSKALFAFVYRTLKQFRLSQAYQVRDILVEAYTRAAKQIEAGKPIHSPLPWFRRTSLNVILEFRRQQEKSPCPLLDEPPSENSCNTISFLTIREDLLTLKWAFKQLDSESSFLLHRHIIEGKSWSEVGKELADTKGIVLSVGALRKRGYKALEKLRTLYKAARLEVRIEWLSDLDEDWD